MLAARPRPDPAGGVRGAAAALLPTRPAARRARARAAAGDPRRPVLRPGARRLPRRRRGLGRRRRRSSVLQEIREQHAAAAGLVALSAATDAELEVAGLGGELKPFQRAGVSYLLERRRAFLADEQGLGKTIEALATLEAAGAYPGGRRLSGEPEAQLAARARALAARAQRAGALAATAAASRSRPRTSRSSTTTSSPRGWRSWPRCAPRALVLDESHYCKNAAAKRTQAVQRLSARGAARGLRARAERHAGDEPTGRADLPAADPRPARGVRLGRRASAQRFRGADAHLRLHWHLRARCFVRRLKADVLPQLPAKTRAIVPVELDNEAEYRLAERDLVAWLRSQPLDLRELDAKVAAALRAERLVRVNALKLLGRARQAARGAGVDPRLLLLGRAAGRVRRPPRDPARGAGALPGRAAHPRRGQRAACATRPCRPSRRPRPARPTS